MRFPSAVLLLAAACCGAAVAAPGPTLHVDRAWVAATPPNAAVAAAYLTIENPGSRPDRLVSVSTPRAARAEVHAIVHEGDLVRMRRVDPLVVAPGARLVLQPGGMHLMLMDISSPFLAGERVPLLLHFEAAGDIAVEAIVQAAATREPGHRHH